MTQIFIQILPSLGISDAYMEMPDGAIKELTDRYFVLNLHHCVCKKIGKCAINVSNIVLFYEKRRILNIYRDMAL